MAKGNTTNQKAMGVELGDFFLNYGDEKLFSKGSLVTALQAIRYKLCKERGYKVNEHKLFRIIGFCREYLETEHLKTVISVRGAGYKLATSQEATTNAAYAYKSLVNQAIRTQRKMPLVNNKYIPVAFKVAFKKDRQLLASLSGNKNFLAAFDDYKNAKKQLA